MVSRVIRWSNVLLILFTLFVYLVPYVEPKTFWPIALLGPTYPWLILLHLGFIAYWAVARKAYFLMSLTCLILGWNNLTAIFSFKLPQSGENADLRAMSYNVYMLQRIMNNDENLAAKRQGAFKSFMASVEPLDVLCAQECPERFTRWLARELKFPYLYTVRGTAILSRHPLLAQGGLNFDNSTNSVAWADIQVKGNRIRVYSVHLQSNSITADATRLRANGDLQERETWVGIKGILRKYRNATQKRADQAAQLAHHIAQSPYPVVLCGDFNDTPVSYAYKLIGEDNGLVDTFRKKGSGAGFTYGGVLPALRIDYILTDPRFVVLNHDRFKKPFSDHFPVLCELAFPE
ncbi:MAG: endonuclease/exonuclease/phosphatase family protein [Saprospirales bacterium]|nr:endonuclease/exonuclease/phosphatase family protein [Saprospirales bacterium]